MNPSESPPKLEYSDLPPSSRIHYEIDPSGVTIDVPPAVNAFTALALGMQGVLITVLFVKPEWFGFGGCVSWVGMLAIALIWGLETVSQCFRRATFRVGLDGLSIVSKGLAFTEENKYAFASLRAVDVGTWEKSWLGRRSFTLMLRFTDANGVNLLVGHTEAEIRWVQRTLVDAVARLHPPARGLRSSNSHC